MDWGFGCHRGQYRAYHLCVTGEIPLYIRPLLPPVKRLQEFFCSFPQNLRQGIDGWQGQLTISFHENKRRRFP